MAREPAAIEKLAADEVLRVRRNEGQRPAPGGTGAETGFDLRQVTLESIERIVRARRLDHLRRNQRRFNGRANAFAALRICQSRGIAEPKRCAKLTAPQQAPRGAPRQRRRSGTPRQRRISQRISEITTLRTSIVVNGR